MSTYLEEVIATKKYTGNVVIQIGSDYFAIRQPDSGLVIASPKNKMVASLTINPTTIDIRKVTTTIASFSFRLIDKDNFITNLVLGDARNLIGQDVRVFLGRSGIDMPFADYYEMPVTYIQKCEHGDNSYAFSSNEQTERMAKPIYAFKTALSGDILVDTTSITAREDVADFPTSGMLKIDDELMSYTSLDLVNNRFDGVIRGELNSVPATHEANADVVFAETVTGNPLDIILMLLVSGGGGGTYDTLESGLAIDEALIDVAEIEALRDELFTDYEYTLTFYTIDSALKYIETELLMPNGLRFTNSRNSKVTLAILDKARFVEETDIIDEGTITKFPKWSIDGTKVTNRVEVSWDYEQGTNVYQKRDIYEDADSIALYGAQTPLKFSFKGIKEDLDGQNLVDDFGTRLVARLATPTPEITINTHIDKSLQTIGDKAYLQSSKIPAADGTLNFGSDLEIISRSINQTTGDVQFKLAFTSFTNIRSGFIAPSDIITSFISQDRVNVSAGRGAYYMAGWYMRLWDEANNVYLSDAPNKIVSIQTEGTGLLTEAGDTLVTEAGEDLLYGDTSTEDTINFEDDWATILVDNAYRIRFADYDEVIASQKRYCFISDDGNDFDDGTPTYRITY